MLTISLIIPCYNEVSNFQKGVLDKIGNYVRDDERFIEVLIVDDGSSDESREVVGKKYLKQFPKFRLVMCPHRGKAPTVISGIQEAKGDFVFFTDADLATPIEEVEKLLDAQASSGAPLIIGSRGAVRPDAPLTRKIMALGMITIRTIIVGLPGIKDTQCGFKLFDRKTALNVIEKLVVFKRKTVGNQASVSAIFDLEFLFIASKLKYKIVEVPVFWRHVETRRVSFFKDVYESLTDMARLKWYEMRGRYKLGSK
jgi:glycosyltransferase involved in cell wall biosynthesis